MSLLRFRSASTASDTTEHERDRAAASDDIMDPAATYAVIVALFLAAGVLEIGARPCALAAPSSLDTSWILVATAYPRKSRCALRTCISMRMG